MKNIFLAAMLCVGLQSVIGASEEPSQSSFLQSITPQFMQDAATATYDYAASWIPQSIKDRVNTWSTKKKLAVAGATMASLLAIYNKDQIIAWATTVLNQPEESQLVPFSMPEVIQNGKWYEVDRLIDNAEKLAKGNTQEEKSEGIRMLNDLISDPNLSKRFEDKAWYVVDLLKDLGVDSKYIITRIQNNR